VGVRGGKEPQLVKLEGRVTRVLFRDEGSLFTALRLRPARGTEFRAAGELMNVAVGDEFTLTGTWERHPKWGPQLKVTAAEKKLPRRPEAITAYLSGGLFSGVGEALARRLVTHFGERTLEVLLSRPEEAERVPGIGGKKLSRLMAALRRHRGIQELALFLQGHGVSLFLTKKIHERYGHEALAVVKADPYRAAEEVPGIGFLRADAIARKIGIPADSPARIRASVMYVLKERCQGQGHSFLPERRLVQECLAFLNREEGGRVGPETVAAAIGQQIEAGRLVKDAPEAIYLREAFDAEVDLARRIRALSAAAVAVPSHLERVLRDTGEEAGLVYAEEQRQAIRAALTSPVAIVTGGPGTGKSTVIRGVIAALRRLRPEASVLLAAPTGRAAKRLTEVTGWEARTIHRLLEFSPESGTFQRSEADPIEGRLLVVDEASMLDLSLASALLRAVPARMQVLFVGDADQLPSVGFGNVFADLIRSATVPVVRLRHVFRQAQQSRIVTNAHLVNQGRMPVLDRGTDCEFVPIEDEAEVAEYVKAAALAYRAAGRPLEEINVLVPMRKGEAGVTALNALLQAALNPPSEGKREIAAGETAFRGGDKVMQVRNNYAKGVFNGDMGVVAAIRLPEDAEEDEEGEERLVVDFEGNRVAYTRADLDQLVLAYACTVHKAQGSEYRGIVLLPVVRQHYVMLQRNLLYTAITRAREHAVLVGQAAAIRRAVTNVGSRLRFSRLADRLKAGSAAVPRTVEPARS
jgi:exodeoxyribonuclease V alpha subunit